MTDAQPPLKPTVKLHPSPPIRAIPVFDSVQLLYGLAKSRGLKAIPCGIDSSLSAVLKEADGGLPPILLFNDTEVSYLLLNVKPASHSCIELVAACIDSIKHRSEVDFLKQGELILLTALRLKSVNAPGPFWIGLNTAEKRLQDGTQLKDDFQIPDALLATWLHYATALEINTTCLIAPGYRPCLSESSTVDSTSTEAFLKGLKERISVERFERVRLMIDKTVWNEGTGETYAFYT